ncbi:MAG: polysaccharide pyruvyl transferase family protein [Treponema sp.]|nr:polysaccharide pyruvyl transferase family protein [Treponema sp.]
MEVGILTFHRAVNYGAVLQAYALQDKIEQMGHEAEIIDYRCKKVEEDVSPLAGFKNKEKFTTAVKKYVFRTKKNRAFNRFFDEYIHLSDKVEERGELSKLNFKYDCFFAGSDQIWNCGCSGDDTAYFLDFVVDGKKKNAYAASFGTDKLFDDDNFDYQSLLNDFNKISVREKSAISIIKEESGRDSEVTLDPTLLLTKEEWKKVVSRRPMKDKYIFVYTIREQKDIAEYTRRLAEKTGYKVINAKSSIEFLQKCSPSDFLSWIYYSEYFITNSFHGTVFSLIFEKQFAIELDNGKNVNNRSKELLELVGVDRTLSLDNMDAIDDPVDYESVKNKLKAEGEKSTEFIASALNGRK